MPTINIRDVSVSVFDAENSPVLQRLLGAHKLIELDGQADLELHARSDGLHLIWFGQGRKPLSYHLDFDKQAARLRSFPAPKQGAFNQALGKKSKCIIDATGGWGSDAFLMCMQGYQVTLFERHPVMAALLEEAFARLANGDWARNNRIEVPTVVIADSVTSLNAKLLPADCVYLDPMFPSKKKKSAVANKQMQLLQWLLAQDEDAQDLAQAAINAAYSRVAVKRPDYALPLIEGPSARFSSKLVHYDVYLQHIV